MQVTVSFDPFNKDQVASALKVVSMPFNQIVANPTDEDLEETTTPKKASKKSKPAPTVSDEEDETFGTQGALDEEDLQDEESDENEYKASVYNQTLSWEEVKSAINEYGNKKPNDMKAILLSFNFKSTAELKAQKKKWEPVYRKVKAHLKAMKKGK